MWVTPPDSPKATRGGPFSRIASKLRTLVLFIKIRDLAPSPTPHVEFVTTNVG
jgi:hypothetical protein